MLRLVILLTVVAFPTPSNAGDTNDDDRMIFNTHCGMCHTVRKGDHRLGPSLYGIYGRKAGQVAGYRGYSGSLAGLTWDEETLDRFMADPASVAGDTNMIFPPLAVPERRKTIIRFLKSFSAL